MKNRFVKAAAGTALAAAAVLAAPAIANAYTPEPVGGSSATIAPGGSATISFDDFAPGEAVTGTLTGENAAAGSVAFVKFAVTSTSTTKTANASGDVSFVVTLPANATGTYTLVTDGAVSDAATVTIAVPAAAGGGSTGGSGTLPATGGDNAALLGLWIGGGALALAGGSIAVASTVRRHRNAEVAA